MHSAFHFIFPAIYIPVVQSVILMTDLDIFSQRLTIAVVDQFIADLKDSVESVRGQPTGKGTMVTLYGSSSAYAQIFV
jgi:hypothetical protein